MVLDLIEVESQELGITSNEACLECQNFPTPCSKEINPVVASHLFRATSKLIDLGTESPLAAERVDELRHFAFQNLKYFDDSPDASTFGSLRKPRYTRNCFYLEDEVGSRECLSCSGKVTLKEFRCGHEAHGVTVIRECQVCRDYEPALKVGEIEKWTVGITTAPRRKPNLSETLQSLSQAGWKNSTVFAEPGSKLSGVAPSIEVSQRTTTLGAWPNFLLSLHELVLREPQSDAYFLCQDDVIFTQGLREYLETVLWPDQKLGVISLHTPRHQLDRSKLGFYPADVGWGAWGAMAFVFPNAAARALLRNPGVINHRNRGMGEGLRNVDSVVGYWCRLSGLPFYLHRPSLCEHIGETTTLWSVDSLEGRRSSGDFPGQEVDIRDWMQAQQERQAKLATKEGRLEPQS